MVRFGLFRGFTVVLVTCKNDEDPINFRCAKVAIVSLKHLQHSPHYKNMRIVHDAQGQITRMAVSVTCRPTRNFDLKLYMGRRLATLRFRPQTGNRTLVSMATDSSHIVIIAVEILWQL